MAKKKHEEHENHERWIIPYAGMVTLLFAFFVVMYAMSLTDEEKNKQVSESVSDAFVGTARGGERTKQLDVLGIKGNPPTARRFVMKRSVTNQEILDELRKSMDVEGFDMIYQNEAEPIQFRIDERGVIISISAGFLFSRNSTEIPVELYPVLEVIADVMKSNERMILIEGHTDGQPVVGTKYYDNWDLSALRATSMAKALIERFEINPSRITASGLGPYRPIASNASESGRAQNRRVDVIMTNAEAPEELLQNEQVPGRRDYATPSTAAE